MEKLLEHAATLDDIKNLILLGEDNEISIDKRLVELYRKRESAGHRHVAFPIHPCARTMSIKESLEFGKVDESKLEKYFKIRPLNEFYRQTVLRMPRAMEDMFLIGHEGKLRERLLTKGPDDLTEKELEEIERGMSGGGDLANLREKRFTYTLFMQYLSIAEEKGLGPVMHDLYQTLVELIKKPDTCLLYKYKEVNREPNGWPLFRPGNITPYGALLYLNVIFEALDKLNASEEGLKETFRNMKKVVRFDHTLLNSYLKSLTPAIVSRQGALDEIVNDALSFDRKKNEESRLLVEIERRRNSEDRTWYDVENLIYHSSRLMTKAWHDSVADFFLKAAPYYMLRSRQEYSNFLNWMKSGFGAERTHGLKVKCAFVSEAYIAGVNPVYLENAMEFINNFYYNLRTDFASKAAGGVAEILAGEKDPTKSLSLVQDYCIISAFLGSNTISKHDFHLPPPKPGESDKWLIGVSKTNGLHYKEFIDWLEMMRTTTTRSHFMFTEEFLNTCNALLPRKGRSLVSYEDKDFSSTLSIMLENDGFISQSLHAFMPVIENARSYKEAAGEAEKLIGAVRYSKDVSKETWYQDVVLNLGRIISHTYNLAEREQAILKEFTFKELCRLGNVHIVEDKEIPVIQELITQRLDGRHIRTSFPLSKEYSHIDLAGISNRASAPEMTKYLIWGLIARNPDKIEQACKYYSKDMISKARESINNGKVTVGKIYSKVGNLLSRIEGNDMEATREAVVNLYYLMIESKADEILVDLVGSIRSLLNKETIFDSVAFRLQDKTIEDLFLSDELNSCAFKNSENNSIGGSLYSVDPNIALLHVVPKYNGQMLLPIGAGILVRCTDDKGRSYIALDTFEGGRDLDRIRGSEWRTNVLEAIFSIGRDIGAERAFINYQLVNPNEQPRRFVYHCVHMGYKPTNLYLKKVGLNEVIQKYGFDKHLLDMFSNGKKSAFNIPEGNVHGAVIELK